MDVPTSVRHSIITTLLLWAIRSSTTVFLGCYMQWGLYHCPSQTRAVYRIFGCASSEDIQYVRSVVDLPCVIAPVLMLDGLSSWLRFHVPFHGRKWFFVPLLFDTVSRLFYPVCCNLTICSMLFVHYCHHYYYYCYYYFFLLLLFCLYHCHCHLLHYLRIKITKIAWRCLQAFAAGLLRQAMCTKSQTPLIRFVVDLLYNKLYNKSTTNPRQIHNKSKQCSLTTTCCGFAVALQLITEENWHDVWRFKANASNSISIPTTRWGALLYNISTCRDVVDLL